MKKEKEQIKKEDTSLKDEELETVNGGLGISLPPRYKPQGWK